MGVFGRSALIPTKQEYISTYAGVPLEETEALGKEIKGRFFGNVEAMGQTVTALNNMYELVSDKDRNLIDDYNSQAKSLMEDISSQENAWEKATMPITKFAMGFAGDEKVKEAQIIKSSIDKKQTFYDEQYASGDLDAERYQWHTEMLKNSYGGLDSYGEEWKTARSGLYDRNPAKYYDMAKVVEGAAKGFFKDRTIQRNPDGSIKIIPISPGRIGYEYNTGIDKAQAEQYISGLVKTDQNAMAYYSELYEMNNGRPPSDQELSSYVDGFVKSQVDKIAHNQVTVESFNDPSYTKPTAADPEELKQENLLRARELMVNITDYEDIDSYQKETSKLGIESAGLNQEIAASERAIEDLKKEKELTQDMDLTDQEKVERQGNIDFQIEELTNVRNSRKRDRDMNQAAIERRNAAIDDAYKTAEKELKENGTIDDHESGMSYGVGAIGAGAAISGEEDLLELYPEAESLEEAIRMDNIKTRADEIMRDRAVVGADYIVWAIKEDNEKLKQQVADLSFGDQGFIDFKDGEVQISENVINKSSGGSFWKVDDNLEFVQVDPSKNSPDALAGATGRITGVMLNPNHYKDSSQPKTMIEMGMYDTDGNGLGTYYVLSPQSLMNTMIEQGSVNEIHQVIMQKLMQSDLSENGNPDDLQFASTPYSVDLTANIDGEDITETVVFQVGRSYNKEQGGQTLFSRIEYLDSNGDHIKYGVPIPIDTELNLTKSIQKMYKALSGKVI